MMPSPILQKSAQFSWLLLYSNRFRHEYEIMNVDMHTKLPDKTAHVINRKLIGVNNDNIRLCDVLLKRL